MADDPLKPVIWVGTSLNDLRDFPSPVQDHMGYALYVAQQAASIRTRKS